MSIDISVSAETINSDGETESTDEEIEPRFQYKRIAKYMQDILNKDAITSCAVHPKFLIFGTFLGSVHLLDHEGNSVDSNLSISNAEFAHTVAVNHVDVDSKGEYLATCSNDGKVNITGLFSDEYNQNLRFERSIKAVALDSDIKSTAGKRFIVGDDKLTMYERNFFKKLRTTVLSTAETAVLSICWNGNFVAWASCLGVRVYDLNDKCSLGLMKWEEPFNARLESFRCNFRWSNENTLLIGWVDTIRICVIRKRNSIEASTRFLPELIVDPVSTFQTTFYICGLAPLTGNQLVALGYPKEKDEQHKPLRPVLCVVEYKMNSSEEIYTDSLLLRGYQEYSVNDYNLGCLIEENRYYIVAPKDIVVASLCDTDYRVNWLVNHCRFEEALEVISEHGGKVPSVTVAKYYIDYLLAQSKFDEAAKTCLRYLGNNKSLWKDEVFNFFKYQQLRALGAYLPTTEDCTLDPQVYEMVLYEYLKFDVSGFLNFIKVWPPRLYDCAAVINAIRDNFQKAHANELLEALAILYSHRKDYESALRMYLRLQNKDVFDLIQHHNLYAVIHKLIVSLINLDRERAFKILLDGSKIPPEIVVEQLEHYQEYLYLYLDALEKHDKCNAFHWRLLNLYVKYDRSKLLPLLRRSTNYPIQEALDVCKQQDFYPEVVYLLERIGSKEEALSIIMHKMNEFEKAVDFCKQQNDNDLWDVLIKESLEKPELIVKLLYSIQDYVDPVSIVNKIKLGQQIPGLRKGIWKMLVDYRLQKQIRQTMRVIHGQMMFRKHVQLVQQQHHAIHLNASVLCAECDESIVLQMQQTDDASNETAVLFYCGHYYHRKCLASNDQQCDEDVASKNICALCKIDGVDIWDVDFDFLKKTTAQSAQLKSLRHNY